MRTRLLTALILLLLLSVAMASLYLQREAWVTRLVNSMLEQQDMRLLRMSGLEIGADSLTIEELELGVGESDARQSLQNLQLEYRLDFMGLDFRARRLTVSRAMLSVPAASEATSLPPVGASWLLTDLAGQLMALPLDSLSIESVEIAGIATALLRQPVQLQARWGEPPLSLEIRNRETQLRVQLDRADRGEVQLTARLGGEGAEIAHLSALLSATGDQQQLRGRGKLALAPLLPVLKPLLNPHSELPAFTAGASGELDFRLTAALGEKLTLNGDRVAFQLELPLYRAAVRGEMPALRCVYEGKMHCDTALELQLQSPELALEMRPAMSASDLKLRLSSQLSLEGGQLTAILQPGEVLRIGQFLGQDLSVQQLTMTLDSAASASYRPDKAQWQLRAERLKLSLPRATTPQGSLATRLDLSQLYLEQSGENPLQARFHLDADSINLQRPGTWLPALSLEADVVLDGPRVTAKGLVNSDRDKPLFSLSAEHHLETRLGTARIQSQSNSFDRRGNRLSRHFSHWPFKWDLYHGAVSTNAGLSWHAGEESFQLQGSFRQGLKEVAGVYGDVGFIGLDGDLAAEFRLPNQLQTTREASLSLKTLEVGVPIEDISTRFQLDIAQKKLTLLSAQGQVFGGRIWTSDAIYQAGRAENRFDIGVDGLQLAQLLALAGYDAVQGSGAISGLLPVNINEAGVIMERGMLAAKAPGGVLRYQAELAADTSPAMKQVIAALDNYHYNILQTEADYLDNGDLVLEMQMRGRNPDYEKGRPIHLNLTVTDNIPKLLESLQAGRVITDTISRKLGNPGL
jgi:hypothetical protein